MLVLTGSVVRTVCVTSAECVTTTVCCAAVTTLVDVAVFRLLMVTAAGVTVWSCFCVAKLVDSTFIVEGFRVVVLPTVWVAVAVTRCVLPACAIVTVLTKEVTIEVAVTPGCVTALVAAIDVWVTRTVEPGSVAARVTRLVTPVVIVIVVVLAAARGMRAPRRTMRAAWVGTQDWVVVVFVVTVLTDVVLTVTELWALTVVVFVLLGSREIVVLIIVDAPLGVIELVMVVVEPSLLVIVVGLGTTV